MGPRVRIRFPPAASQERTLGRGRNHRPQSKSTNPVSFTHQFAVGLSVESAFLHDLAKLSGAGLLVSLTNRGRHRHVIGNRAHHQHSEAVHVGTRSSRPGGPHTALRHIRVSNRELFRAAAIGGYLWVQSRPVSRSPPISRPPTISLSREPLRGSAGPLAALSPSAARHVALLIRAAGFQIKTVEAGT
jgi:hypothetical protein